MSWWSRLANVFRETRVDRDLDAELQFHMEERIRELTAAGLSPEAAAAQAARRFGSPLRWREQSRDVKLLPSFESMLRDLRLGVRMLRKNAMVTAAAVLSLSLALGACAAAFALIDALILRPLPVRDPQDLVYLAFPTYTAERPEADTFNDPTFVRLRDAGRGTVDLFAMSTQVMRQVRYGDGGKEPARTQFVSGDAFGTLGVGAAAGRLFNTQDDQRSAHPVAVVSHAYWVRRFGSDQATVGRVLTLDDRQFEIVGVAERRFTGVEPGRPTDVWLPYATYNPRAFDNFQFNWFRILGRLHHRGEGAQAASILQAAFTTLRREYAPREFGPNRPPDSVKRFLETPLYLRSAENGPSPLRRQFERSLWILVTIAALVLLIAGSNVANLFLARTAVREREMALRLSIGAGRGRLIQQLLVESSLVAAAVCLLALAFAQVAAPLVAGMLTPADDPVRLDLRLHWRLLAFAGLATIVTTALFGLVPAVRASAVAPLDALRSGGRSETRTGVMRPFVALQVGFSLVVLFVGGLLVQSFARVSSVNPGFASSNVLLISLDPVRREDPAAQRAALFQILDRLRTVPGVQAASSADYNVIGRAWTNDVRMPGTSHDTIEVTMAPVTSGFFETMQIPVLAGRGFIARDIENPGATAIVVNQAFAARYFGHEAAVGRTLDAQFGEADSAHEVVGVVGDTRYDLRKPVAPTIYIPLRPRGPGTIHVRVAGDSATLASRLREEIRAASPLFRVTTVVPQSLVVDQTLLRERLLALLSGFFAVIGLVLAAVGLYGVLSYSVVQRTREIGIRVALGAPGVNVIRTVIADTGGAVLAGTGCGLAGGLYLARFVEALLFEVSPLDFSSFALPIAALLVGAAVAAAVPALRAARIDPAAALRCE
jgi:predicted permease